MRTIYYPTLVAILLLCAWPAMAIESKSPRDALAAKALELSKQRFLVYTASFAKRFKLPPLEPEPRFGAGLEAVEIGFGPRANSEWLGCYMSIYLTSNAISNDELGREVSSGALETRRHFFLDVRPDGTDARLLIPAADAEHLLERQSRYFRQAGFTTVDFVPKKSGQRRTVSLQEMVRDLLPGITYIRTGACVPSSMIAHGKGVDFGVRQKGAPDYSRIAASWRDEHFARFSLPPTLLETALPALQAFEKFFEEVTLEVARSRREAKGTK